MRHQSQKMKFKERLDRKKENYSFTRRLYRFIRNHSDHICFKKLYGGWVGQYDPQTTNITLDYRRDVIATLIHEFLHHIHPKWSETKVKIWESRIINSLTPRQYKNIIRVLAEHI